MIKTAVIPVAGFGTRMLPASKSVPKEMLPLADKPIIDFIIRECVQAGIEQVVLVSHASKVSLEDYFDCNEELEMQLINSGKKSLLNRVREITPEQVTITSVRQRKVAGLGHAILAAKKVVGNQCFAVLLPDVLVHAENKSTNILAQMINQLEKTASSQVLLEPVDDELVPLYGIAQGVKNFSQNDCFQLSNLIEKPELSEAPSNLAVVGRYVFTPSLWECLENTSTGVGGEVQLTDAIQQLIQEELVYGFKLKGRTMDCGNKQGYYRAFVEQVLSSGGNDRQAFLQFLREVVVKNIKPESADVIGHLIKSF